MFINTDRMFRDPFTSRFQYVLHSLLLQRITRWHFVSLYLTFSLSPFIHWEQHLEVRYSSTFTTFAPIDANIFLIFFTGAFSDPHRQRFAWKQRRSSNMNRRRIDSKQGGRRHQPSIGPDVDWRGYKLQKQCVTDDMRYHQIEAQAMA